MPQISPKSAFFSVLFSHLGEISAPKTGICGELKLAISMNGKRLTRPWGPKWGNLKKIFSTLFETPNFAVLSFSLVLVIGNEGVIGNFGTIGCKIKFGEKVTKAEVITEIANKTGVDKADVSTTIEAFFKVVKGSLAENENVYFRNFGSFVVKKRAQKVARIISKNKSMIIPEHNIPAFKPAKSFVSKVKDSSAKKAVKA